MSRMRCSRRCGVILIYCADNGYFVAYTSPPPTAEPLLKEKPFGGHSVQLSLVAELVCHTQPTSPWHADRRSAQGVRSTTEGEIFKGTDGACADPGTQNFPCHGGSPTSPAFQFYSIDFYVTHRFFVTFFTEESNVLPRPSSSSPLVPPRPLFPSKKPARG